MQPSGKRRRGPGPAWLTYATLPGVLVAGAGAPAWAQDAARWPSGTEDPDQGWRGQSGNHLAWVQPDFDGSGWPTVAPTARAAQTYGQGNDMTVLRLAYTGAEVLHA
jgi:hypothetical protein